MIEVSMQPTPNPMAMKFIVNRPLKNEGKATFTDPKQADGLKMVESVFQIPGVTQVHLFQNTMSVTHTGELNDDIVADQVESVIKTRGDIHNPDFQLSDQKSHPTIDRSSLSAERQQVEEILDRTIRPGLQADGGDIEVISLENNELKVIYQGACGGCPSAMMGTLDAIQSILQNELKNPELVVSPL